MGVTQAAGLSLRWFRDQFGAGAQTTTRDPYERLTDGGCRSCARLRRPAVDALPDGRTHAASRSQRARRAGRPDRLAHPRAHRSRHSRGRGVQPARYVHDFRRDESAGAQHSPGRRRSALALVAADSGRRRTATKSRLSRPRKAQPTARQFSPESVQECGLRSMPPAAKW